MSVKGSLALVIIHRVDYISRLIELRLECKEMLCFFLQYLFDFFSSCGNSIILKIFYLMVWYEFSFVHAHRDFMASAKGFTLLPIMDRILCIGVFFCKKRIYSNDSSIFHRIPSEISLLSRCRSQTRFFY